MHESTSHYQTKIDELREQLGYDFVSLAFARSAADSFVLTWQFASGNLNQRYKRIVLQTGRGIAGIVFKTGKPMLVPDVQALIDQDKLMHYPIIVSERLSTLTAIPLFQLGRVSGVLLAGNRGDRRMTEQTLKGLQQYLNGQFGLFEIKELTVH